MDVFVYIIWMPSLDLLAEYEVYDKTEKRFGISTKNRSRYNFEIWRNLKSDFYHIICLR